MADEEKRVERDVVPSGEVQPLGNATSEGLQISLHRRTILHIIFCLSIFIDGFLSTSMIIAVDGIRIEFGLPTSIGTWIITAYNLTFGSFMLLAGRISDIYHPKLVFVCGFSLIGIVGIGGGFAHSIIPLAIVRALQGIGAAMTTPSATTLLTMLYTTPMSRGLALTSLAAFGTMGLCSGFIFGGLIVQFATWRWIMWITALVTIPLSALSVMIIPGKKAGQEPTSKKMDIAGIALITSALILLVFSLSQAPVVGWATARVLAPLIISIFMIVAFFYWQTCLPDEHALIPPRLWFFPNFLVLVFVSFTTQIYITAPVFVFSEYWPASYGWSALTIGLHVLPIGVVSAIVCTVLAPSIVRLPPRPALVCAGVLCGCFSILMTFASSRDRYWSYVFPALVFTTIGSSAGYMISNIGIITSVAPNEVGIAAGIFNAALQVGGAISIAVVTTILAQLRGENPYPSFKAPSAAMWFIVALGLLQAAVVLVFFKPRPSGLNEGAIAVTLQPDPSDTKDGRRDGHIEAARSTESLEPQIQV